MLRTICALLLVSACAEKGPDVANAKTYEDAAIAFQHPGDWTVDKSERSTGGINVTTVSVTAKDGFAMIYVATPKTEVSLDTYRGMLAKRMEDAVKQVTRAGGKVEEKKEAAERTLAGAKRTGQRVRVSLSGGGQQLDLTQELYDLSTDKAGIVLVTQVGDMSAARNKPGYDLMFDSLRVK